MFSKWVDYPPLNTNQKLTMSKFVIKKEKRDICKALVQSGKNVLLTGGTGCGKTTFAVELAQELNLNPVIINCGSTQDARASLIGYFTLHDGNTQFQEADLLKAIQEPNTMVILDELSRASDDALNILFPLLDFRQDIRVDERDTDRVVKLADNVKFMATANVGLEYSATRSIDRALQDRFLCFNVPYLTGKQLKNYIKTLHGETMASTMSSLCSIYEYSHKMVSESKINTAISTRMILDVIPLAEESAFTTKQIVDNVILSIFKTGSNSIINDSSIIREYADSLGVYE
jgi:MoxR-like ATPase|tara:strand:+ start:132 stop:998 length:867 start_codon:yes stop_codon:yes gene_type:complete